MEKYVFGAIDVKTDAKGQPRTVSAVVYPTEAYDNRDPTKCLGRIELIYKHKKPAFKIGSKIVPLDEKVNKELIEAVKSAESRDPVPEDIVAMMESIRSISEASN